MTSPRRRELTTAAVAERLQLDRKTIIAMGDNGILDMIDRSAVAPGNRKKRNLRFFADDVEAYEQKGGTVESRKRSRAS